MATLHVRNVPDLLYEELRRRAEANGRSIGAEAILIVQAQFAPEARQHVIGLLGRRRRPGPGLFTRFTDEARQVVVTAQEEARGLAHDHVGTEHLLVALLAVESAASDALNTLGLTLEQARAEVERLLGRGAEEPTGQIPFQPGAKEALELALREALRLRDDFIGPEHLLLGVVDQETGPGAEIVRAVEPGAAKVRACVLQARAARGVRADFEPEPPFRVLELDGDARAWEAQLNEAAAEGYDLVEIVGSRAILSRS